MTRVGIVALTLALATLAGGTLSSAATITSLSDGFDSENATSFFNFNAFDNWDVSEGVVDLIKSGEFGPSCSGGIGFCVDLDGTGVADGNSAGTMVTKDVFAVGSYTVKFWLSGNLRGHGDDTVKVSLGTWSETITLPQNAALAEFVRVVALTSLAPLKFEHAGGDQYGIVLDTVSVEQTSDVPLPAAFPLLAAAVGAMSFAGALRARRSA